MFDAVECLVIDLLEWLQSGERSYDEVMDAWRTSCPRFPVWEDANERGLVAKHHANGRIVVTVTASGRALLSSTSIRLTPINRRPADRNNHAEQTQAQVVFELALRYEIGMKSNASRKSSFTLPAAEHAQVLRLRRLLKARSNTEVIRRSLKLLEDSVSREQLRQQFREASARVRSSSLEAMQELDPLVGEGLENG